MANSGYTIFTLLGILLIGGALALQILYIKNNQNSEDYFPHQIGSVAMDTLVVLYIMYTLVVYRPYDSNVYSGIAVSLLIFGLGLEIVGTQFNITNSTSWVAYLLAVVNALVRLYILIQTKCNTASTTVEKLASQMLLASKTQVATPHLGTIDPDNLYKNSMNILNDALFKKPESKEDQAIYRNKLKDLFGKSEPRPTGGRRR